MFDEVVFAGFIIMFGGRICRALKSAEAGDSRAEEGPFHME